MAPLPGTKERPPAGGMILQFKYSSAIVGGVPKSLHVRMAVGEMLHRSAGYVRRSAEEGWRAAVPGWRCRLAGAPCGG